MTIYPKFMTKQCFVCEQWKPIESFYTDKKMVTGHTNKCKECTKSYIRERRKLPEVKEYIKEFLCRPEIKERNRIQAQAPHRKAIRKAYSKTEKGREILLKSTKEWQKETLKS